MGILWLPFGLTPKPKNDQGPNYADIYARAVAASVDVFLIFFLLGELFQRIGREMYQTVDPAAFDKIKSAASMSQMIREMWDNSLISLWTLNCAVQVAIIAVLMISVQWIWGSTPGKKLMGLRIVDARTLEDPAPWRYVLRFFAYIPAALPFMLGIFWVSFNKERRGWHDYIAGTTVIHNKPRGWYWEQVKRLWRKYVLKKDVSAN